MLDQSHFLLHAIKSQILIATLNLHTGMLLKTSSNLNLNAGMLLNTDSNLKPKYHYVSQQGFLFQTLNAGWNPKSKYWCAGVLQNTGGKSKL